MSPDVDAVEARTDPTPPPQPDAVEPLMSLADFLVWKRLTPAATAALKRWLAVHGHATTGHAPAGDWQTWYTQMLTT